MIYLYFDDFELQKYHIDEITIYFDDFSKLKIYIMILTLVD